MRKLECGRVWGGIRNENIDVTAAGLTASLYSSAAQGGKGGDIYYFSVCNADRLTHVAVADVAGHGDAVSHVSDWLYQALAKRVDAMDGNHVLEELNRLTWQRGLTSLSTAAVIEIYPREGRLFFSYAGHPPALLRHAGNGGWSPIQAEEPARSPGAIANLPLGVSDDTRYPQSDMPLARGDRVFLYTDGLIEAPGRNRSPFGAERLHAVLDGVGSVPPADVKRAVLDEVHAHTGGRLDHDDVTLIAIEVD